MSEKLQKMLASAGLGSRRELEKWITAGRVSVNGRTATLGDRAEAVDRILVDGRPVLIAVDDNPRVLMYSKPEGEICTNADPKGRRTVFDSLPRLVRGRWIAVGRLDINTSGLLLFTNHGELANRLMHPSSEVRREYLVRVHGSVDEAMITRLTDGVVLDDGIARFQAVKAQRVRAEEDEIGGSNRWFRVVLSEGRTREVRRLWESQGVEVNRLKRISFGPIELPSIVRRADFLELDPKQIRSLFDAVKLKVPGFSEKAVHKDIRERKEQKLRSRGSPWRR